ncbi:MAG: phospholipase D-like domain-containing protein [Actinobacteria bacterium]|nr:phospholipase D-like domain-containing protein [Patescibacteria group bacterium]MCL5069937.1 phospholipase D-like domain-containing protein [Actinomycetota bacterium]
MSLLSTSQLHDEKTFYQTFLKDLEKCQNEVIIESPYITSQRMRTFDRVFKKLLKRGVKIYIMTRDPKEHYEGMEIQSEAEISRCEVLGVQVLLCVGNHHRKLAILDRKILWEGSLNILSQTYSREIMRRIENEKLTTQMFNFLNLVKFL